ncbi:MAG TPA: bifunctional serine/threonine-protein kinase/formylglycine-generating enzyme family protein [Kofleriaceae bacterium]|nr:bifunctional serine/threonine-protein kinase/formylglycine-generating enzyme family protein [Kofleriaceae bacterium]
MGEFRIRSLLGEGSMGQVYLAQDTTLGRRVALKLIKRSMMRADGVARFLQEARATASLSHPHIVTLHAVGEYDGRPFLALEYVDGESLRARITGGVLPVREALRITLAITLAIAEAHRGGLVHSDLKPENVVIPRDGRVRVVDFGLARLVGTTSDSASGTPAYMAPERWRGQPPTGAIDIWAVGVMLHELITGERPIADGALAILAFDTSGRSPYAATGAPWSALVAACLALDPAKRPSADEVVQRLSALLDPRTIVEAETRCPFPGLAAFTRADAADYFGRGGELDAMIERLRTQPLVPIVGPSGTGKSSFVYAAVIPRLDDTGPWTVRALRPGAAPFASLAAALADASDGQSDAVAATLRRNPEALSLMLGGLAHRSGGRVLVFVDQFEEAFTLASPDSRAFCDCLALAALADEPWRIVLTVRDDFFGRLSESPPMRMLLGAVLPLAPLAGSELRAAVLGPLRNAGYAADAPELIERIVTDVEHQPACLPLLQFTCQALWDRRDTAARQLLSGAYDAIGGASGALATHAQQLIAQLTPGQVRLARKLLLALLNPDGTRRPRLRSELLDGMPDHAGEVVDRLLERRLVVSARETEADDATLEVAHEALATAWPQLARWLDETYEERLLVVEIEQASQLWQRRGKRDEETWAGAALSEAVRRVAEWNLTLAGVARAFLAAGEHRARRERRRRRWLMWAATGTLSVVAIVAVLLVISFARKQTQIDLAGNDMGEFELRIDVFDWDPVSQTRAVPVARPSLAWQLRAIDARDPQLPGEPIPETRLQVQAARWVDHTFIVGIEVRSGPAFLSVERGDCAPSWIYLQRLPGYVERSAGAVLTVSVPSCQASRADTIEIPAGEFFLNTQQGGGKATVDEKRALAGYRIDRTEVTRAAFQIYGAMEPVTGDGAAPSPYMRAGQPSGTLPVVGVNFVTARRYCWFLGKQLPSVEQWQKAFRGGLVVAGKPNPEPTRMTPWLTPHAARPANLDVEGGDAGLAPVGSFPDDTSPYGVVDLAGNASEWTSSPAQSQSLRGLRVVLGADWGTPEALGHQRISWRNVRPDRYLDFGIGIRCVTPGP